MQKEDKPSKEMNKPYLYTSCPNCGHKITLPTSVKQYTCICGKEYEVKRNIK